MTLAVRAVFWVLAYLGAVVSPLVFAAIGASHPDHGFWTNFSVALGFTGLAMMGLEFALVARFRLLAAPFGQDALLQFHRQIGYVGLAFILGHFAISAKWNEVTLTQAMYWPYDDEARVIEERVYRGNDRRIRRCKPEEVITSQECRDKLLPLLRPVAKPY